MGYSVYWSNGRFQGYGVPAYCDYPGCTAKINRGLAYAVDEDESTPRFFSCEHHKNEMLFDFEINDKKENLDWIKHILTDESWSQWRKENAYIVRKYTELLS